MKSYPSTEVFILDSAVLDGQGDITWQGRTAGGSSGHNALVGILRCLPVRLVYFFMYFGAVWLFIVHVKERRSIIRYFREVLGYGRFLSFFKALENHFIFGMNMVDRFAVYARGTDVVRMDVEPRNDFTRLCAGTSSGILVAGAHIGNFEIGGYTLKQNFKKIHVFAYAGEEAALQGRRSAAFGQTDVIMENSGADLSNLFSIKNFLDEGDVVAIMCDRFNGREKSSDMRFMGREACFPSGMFRIAGKLGVPVVSMFVIRTGCLKYKVFIRELCSGQVFGKGEMAAALMREYVSDIERIISEYPEQWFNYYDFWKYGD